MVNSEQLIGKCITEPEIKTDLKKSKNYSSYQQICFSISWVFLRILYGKSGRIDVCNKSRKYDHHSYKTVELRKDLDKEIGAKNCSGN